MNPFGNIKAPEPLARFGDVTGGFGSLFTVILRLMIVIGGIYALINFILAGYTFLSAGSDSKKIEEAWAKIYQSVIGLLVMAGAFVLAAVFGYIIFGNASFIINPILPTPAP